MAFLFIYFFPRMSSTYKHDWFIVNVQKTMNEWMTTHMQGSSRAILCSGYFLPWLYLLYNMCEGFKVISYKEQLKLASSRRLNKNIYPRQGWTHEAWYDMVPNGRLASANSVSGFPDKKFLFSLGYKSSLRKGEGWDHSLNL